MRALVVFTGLCAIIAAAARQLAGPSWFAVVLAAYFITLAGFAACRTLHILRRFGPRWRQIRRRRAQLEDKYNRQP